MSINVSLTVRSKVRKQSDLHSADRGGVGGVAVFPAAAHGQGDDD
jgi:hypothetical protein